MKNKQIRFLNLLILIFCLSLSVAAQKGSKPDSAETSVKRIEEAVKFLSELHRNAARKTAELPPPKEKYIMTVINHFTIVSSDFIGAAASPVLSNDLVIMLTGTASPNTPPDFVRAYLIFVDKPTRRPQLDQRVNEKVLTIWYPRDYAAIVEATLKDAKNVYCWIGNYGDGSQINIHADIHADY